MIDWILDEEIMYKGINYQKFKRIELNFKETHQKETIESNLDSKNLWKRIREDQKIISIIFERDLFPRNPEVDNQLKENVVFEKSEPVQYKCIFSPVFPENQNDSLEKSQFLPYFYPKVEKFSIEFDEKNKKLYLKAIHLKNSNYKEKMGKIAIQILSKFKKWFFFFFSFLFFFEIYFLFRMIRCQNQDYVKKFEHDKLVSKEEFKKKNEELKRKYKNWVDDPFWKSENYAKKSVFEDISIASYLICLWEKEKQQEKREINQTFLDLGCGNGFLVYLLTKEGFFLFFYIFLFFIYFFINFFCFLERLCW